MNSSHRKIDPDEIVEKLKELLVYIRKRKKEALSNYGKEELADPSLR